MNNLRKIRKEKGLRSDFVAKQLNISRQALYQYENNKREIGNESLRKLSQIYGVSIDYLLGNTFNNESQSVLQANDLGVITEPQSRLFKMIQKLDNDRFYMVYGYTERLLREMI